MKLYAVLKVNTGKANTSEPFITNICTSKTAAINAAEHVFDDFLSDYTAQMSDGPLDVNDSFTYKTAMSTTGVYGIIVKVQELSFSLTVNA